MDLLWLAVLIQTVYFIVNRAYALIILFILLSLGLQLWKKTSVVYLLIPMLICQIVFFVWRQRFGNTRETFLFKKKKSSSSNSSSSKSPAFKSPAFKSVKLVKSIAKKATPVFKKEEDDREINRLKTVINGLEKKIESVNDALSS